jgi:hypothetical protein
MDMSRIGEGGRAALKARRGGALSCRAACVAALLVAAPALLGLPGEAWAACAPAAGSNVTATCTGTTDNQGGGAPGTSASFSGYGTGIENLLTVTVVPGASVTGSSEGISFIIGTVFNYGTVSGGTDAGIFATSMATVSNYGTILGGSYGIDAVNVNGSATVSNSGTISGGFYGIDARGNAIVSNSGTISGGTYALFREVRTRCIFSAALPA